MPRVLAISGKRLSGKDTFAAMIREHAGRRGLELPVHAFAAESKRMFAEAARSRGEDVDLERLLHDRAYKEALRPRLTRFTMDAIEADPLVFCRRVADRIEAGEGPALIGDLRLRLEIEHLRSRFELRVARLARSDEARERSGWSFRPGVDDHPTETELDDPSLWDEVVPNEGSLEELDARAARVLSALQR